MLCTVKLVGILLAAHSVVAQSSLGPSAYTVPGPFPASIYQSYYNDPTATAAQPQPVISDPVTHEIFPYALTNPDTIPLNDTQSPHPLPFPASSSVLLEAAVAQIISISKSAVFDSTCAKCQASLEVAKFLSLAAPEEGPTLAVRICEYFNYSKSCATSYGIYALGSSLTQVAAFADAGGYDGESLCWNFLGLCPRPPTSPLDLTTWFAKPKPSPLPPPKQPSGERLKVLHLSDMHLDSRYATGSEANCTSSLCCRANNFNVQSPDTPLLPAPRYGAYLCDSPISLITSSLEAIPVLTGTQEAGFNFTVYTGDLVAHDPDNELSDQAVLYAETVLYDLLKRMLPSNSGPVYAVLGNHDTHSQAQNSPSDIGGGVTDQFNWDYDHLAELWQLENWIDAETAAVARTHYAAYSVTRSDGLRIITLNTDFWYKANFFAHLNLSSSDNSGMLRFLTDELQAAEDAGQRGNGWDGSNPLQNPTNLFYQIVDRFSPHVIANVFFGHTHEDELQIFYANNATNISTDNALSIAWIAPSITPLTNLNSGFRVYEVDSATFDVLDAYTFASNVNSFPALDNQSEAGPEYYFEYSTREAYGESIAWGANDPLNATWWHLVTEAMEANTTLVSEVFNTFQGKSSVKSPPCTGDCVTARICYMRSGSASIANTNCVSGYGSVQ
ncbi:Metallo-dependent phosphatase [Sparassis latifolia]